MLSDSSLYESCPDGEKWGTGCLVLRNNEILLGLRTDNNLWCTPGGRVDPGESPITCVLREVKEEVNIDLNPRALKYVGQCYSLNENVIWHSFFFVCNIISGVNMKPQIREMSELRWVPINDLPKYKLFKPSDEAIRLTLQVSPELLYPDIYRISKMTAMEQLVGVKNPGKNGGLGSTGSTGNWKYTKPGKGKNKTAAPTQSIPKTQNQIKQLKQSYVQYFQSKAGLKRMYTIQDGKFVFPNYSSAVKSGIAKDNESYRVLFNEQFMLFSISSKS